MDPFPAASAELQRVVAAVPPDAWDNQTPADLSVHEVVNHVVAGNVFAVRLLAGATAEEATSGLDDDRLNDDPMGAVSTSCAAQQAAFATVDADRMLHHPSGDISVPTFVRLRLGELVVHAWDIAVGVGLDPTLEPGVVDDLWARVEPHVEDLRRLGTYGAGASGRLSPAASTQTRLLDAFGRRP